MDFTLIEKAGLSQQEFADIVGVSRVTLGKLIGNGNVVRIEKGLQMLDVLVSNGRLPRGYGREDRVARAALADKLKERFDKIAS